MLLLLILLSMMNGKTFFCRWLCACLGRHEVFTKAHTEIIEITLMDGRHIETVSHIMTERQSDRQDFSLEV